MKRISLVSITFAAAVIFQACAFLHAQQTPGTAAPAPTAAAPVRAAAPAVVSPAPTAASALAATPAPARPTQVPPAASTTAVKPAAPARLTNTEDDCDRDHGTHNLNYKFDADGNFSLPPAEALKKFVEAYTRFDILSEEHEDISQEYEEATPEQQKVLAPRLIKISKDVHNLYHELQDLAEPAWMANPQQEEVVGFLLFLMASALDEDQYEVAYDLAREMMGKLVHQQEPILYEMAGIAAFMVNQYPVAAHCFKEAAANDEFTETGESLNDMLPYYNVAWKEELALRQKEAAANDLPRVLLKTTKGDVLVELFEDQAPNTVANFISLVEKGFYDNNDFHTVVSGFMAQTGSPEADGTGTPGYTITDECTKPGARRHYRGSLSMAHLGPNTAGSQFFICLVPTSHLDGKYTVFGRVIHGIDVISALERIDAASDDEDSADEPDKIIKAQVTRKRNHAYVPQKSPIKPAAN